MTRGFPICAAIVAAVVAAGCYRYRPVEAPEPGMEVRAQLRSEAAEQDAGGEEGAPAAAASEDPGTDGEVQGSAARESPRAFQGTDRGMPAERSIWPMVLFTGIALMVGAA